MNSLIENLVIEAAKDPNLTQNSFKALQRRFCRSHKTTFDTSDKLIRTYQKLVVNNTIESTPHLERILTMKSTRSDSGIVVVSVLTKPYPCPGKCIYCPTEKNVPKSYLSSEPAVRRAIMCKYHPFTQVKARLESLEAIGHQTEKICIRIIGGTWSYYPKGYQNWFVRELFRAANDKLSFRPSQQRGWTCLPAGREIFSKDLLTEPALSPEEDPLGRVEWARDDNNSLLKKLQGINETARHRIVEISVETRQDYINHDEVLHLRKLGVTKVELGVQSIDDKILKFVKRGNLDTDTIQATKLLKDSGFKVSYQMMLNLPKSNPGIDVAMFEKIFNDPKYCPDHLKIYPLALVENTGLMRLYNEGNFRPYNEETLIRTIVKIKKHIPYYCRVERVIRDIPSNQILEGGAKVSNLRQMVQAELNRTKQTCHCIRCREVKNTFDIDEEYRLFRQDFDASGGKEIFLSLENLNRTKLYSLLRLRIPGSTLKQKEHIIPSLSNAALIRELHTYGPTLGIGERSRNSVQHQGFGKKLVLEAENIAKNEFCLSRVAVIAGVGVRQYFRDLGYSLDSTYMIKNLVG